MFSTWKTEPAAFDLSPIPQAEPTAGTRPTVIASSAASGLKPAAAAAASEAFSVINEWLNMRGDLEGDGGILVKGKVHGNIRCKMLIVDTGALVEGGIEADDVVIRGEARGMIRTQRIRLEKTAMVDCEIYHDSFCAEEGARVKGMMHANDGAAASAAASPARKPLQNSASASPAGSAPSAAPKTPQAQSPEAKVSSALYQMLDVARSGART